MVYPEGEVGNCIPIESPGNQEMMMGNKGMRHCSPQRTRLLHGKCREDFVFIPSPSSACQ